MDIQTLVELSTSERFFAIIFVVGIVFLWRSVQQWVNEMRSENREREDELIGAYREQVEKAHEREGELMVHLDKSTQHMKEIADTLQDIQGSVEKLETRLEGNLSKLWKEIGGKADKAELYNKKEDK